MAQIACTIAVDGEVDRRFENAFDGLTLNVASGRTELTGTLADQAQLQGVLRHLFDLGMVVVSFTSTPAPGEVGPAGSAQPTVHPGEVTDG